MGKPIFDNSYWQGRLAGSKQVGELRNSVYVTTPEEWEKIDEAHARILNVFIKPQETVLDAACGYGRASTFFPGIYHGLDISEDLIAEARKLYPDKVFTVGDLKNIQTKDGWYDWAVCISLKTMIIREASYRDWMEVQNELIRVTRKGILVLEYGNGDDPDVYSLIARG